MIVERRIITGLIVSADYLRRVAPFWDDALIDSPEMRRIARWCLDHFARYGTAPDRDIGQVYATALRDEGIPKAEAELIEHTLEGVSDDYGRGDQFNAAYLYDRTVAYLRERELASHNEGVADLIARGQLEEAEQRASSFSPRSWATTRGLDLFTEQGYERVEAAFKEAAKPLVEYPKPLGDMLNPHLVRDGFVAFMAPEKRGKTWILMDLAFRALRKKAHVAFFQAGDLTEGQALRRIAIHLSGRSDDPRYCQPSWRPIGDCARNQFDLCRRSDRNCDFGVFDAEEHAAWVDDPWTHHQASRLVVTAQRNPDYRPCDAEGCREREPCAWLMPIAEKKPLTGPDAAGIVRAFNRRWRRRFRLATYPGDTLTTAEVRSCLAEWERQDDFVPDVIVVDYADLMTERVAEFRHRQDAIWKGLRGISQAHHALVVTATQSDADSYRSNQLRLSNFSEDKRKYGHVTAMFALNQDPGGREKALGVLRVGGMLVREGAFDINEQVVVLQDLAAGRPVLESYRVVKNVSGKSPDGAC